MRGQLPVLVNKALGSVIRNAALQDETAVAVAAINISAFVNFQPDTRMAESCAAGNVSRPVTRDTAAGDGNCFWNTVHGRRLASRRSPRNYW